MSRSLTLAALLFLAIPASAAGVVWLEGESPTRAGVKFTSGGWGKKEYLSGQKWLHATVEADKVEKTIPADGARLEYDFTVAKKGRFEVWMRLGFEFVRSPFRWNIDDGKPREVGPQELTTDLMAISDWNEVAWLELGDVELTAGKHTFHFVLPRVKKGTGFDRVLFGLDCICLSAEAFRPNGPHQPGSKWQTKEDDRAAKRVIDITQAEGDRVSTALGGLWQVARFDENDVTERTEPVQALPKEIDTFHWHGIRVPGGRDEVRPDLTYCHRLLYRCRVQIPEAKGRSYVLHLPSTSLMASVIVNGRFCGFSKAPCAAWDADISRAVKPGRVNEIVVVIKDAYYALAQTGDGKSARFGFNVPPDMFHNAGGLNLTRFADFPILFKARRSGILETPSLVVTPGEVYAADVFVQPSVKKKQLTIDLTLTNPTSKPRTVVLSGEVVPLSGGKAELTLGDKTVMVPAGGQTFVSLTRAWEKPRLWWPDEPNQYNVILTLTGDKKVSDRSVTKFGFREWGISGKTFTLNGIPWRFRADLTFSDKAPKDPLDAVKTWRKIGLNTFRFWGDLPWIGESQRETLDFFDAHGMAVRRSGIFDGEIASYMLVEEKNGKTVARKALFDNWILQLEAWVKAERNHPSIHIWSIENEITYINTRNLGWLGPVEPEIKRAIAAVMKLDPTRPVMIDGGDALMDRSLPVYGNHYNEFALREYPDEAYTLKLAKARYKTPGRDPWPIGDDKPLFLGESFFASGYQPSAFAQVSGEGAFLGWPEARRGVGLFAKMLSEGYRWNDVAAFHFWLGPDRGDLHYNSWQPVCVLCREWNWTFVGGQKIKRTLKVFNDTRFDHTIRVRARLKGAKGFNQDVELKAGEHREMIASFDLPDVESASSSEMVLTCEIVEKGKAMEVFREVKAIRVLPSPSEMTLTMKAKDLLVLDPKGVVQTHLKKRGVAFTEATFDKLTPARVIVVGPDALTARQATDPKWQALAAAGARILVLDQSQPLRFQAIPADLEMTNDTGRIAFPENLAHPAFVGLAEADFFCWSGDHVVYRSAYRKAGRGARSLLQCDEGLSDTALCECPLRDGLLILCQAVVGSKLATDPVAQRLFDNLLVHAAIYAPVEKKTAIVLDKTDSRAKLLASVGLKATPSDDLLAAIADPTISVVVADASAANLKKLTADRKTFDAFTSRGGQLLLWGLTPAGLLDFNRLVGIDHAIRPFRMERVTMAARRDPILAGLTTRDVVLESTRKIFPWSGDLYPADDAFTHIVDLDDIAPFCECPEQPWGWGQMTNGLVSADAWVFIYSHDLKSSPKPRWTAKLPREHTIREFSIVPNTFYYPIRKLKLVFDGDEKTAMTIDLKPAMTRQDFAIDPPRKAKSITLVPVAWDVVGTNPVISVENLWIRVERDAKYRDSVVPLLNIGGLVKYRMGKGGIVLNQLRVNATETNPANDQKKRAIVTTLLGNLGSGFAAGKVLVAGANLRYTPIPLAEKCNQYLTKDKGWLQGDADLGAFPVGEQTLASVRYLIRDFRTSPLPSCVMLAGPGAKGDLPREVKGIPIGKKADVLYFLHTFHPIRAWKADKPTDLPPVVVEYVVTYADGKTEVIAVRLDRGIGGWLVDRAAGLPGAAVAWAAPAKGKQTVVYSMPWTNPRPGVEIKSLTMRFNKKEGGAWGVPALLGVTAALAE